MLIFGGAPAEPTKAEVRKVCASSNDRKANIGYSENEENAHLPLIYVVTPTYKRPEMIAELTRLGQTLLLVPQVHWVVAEDSPDCTEHITQLLVRLGIFHKEYFYIYLSFYLLHQIVIEDLQCKIV